MMMPLFAQGENFVLDKIKQFPLCNSEVFLLNLKQQQHCQTRFRFEVQGSSTENP